MAVTEANGNWRTVEFGLHPDADWARAVFEDVQTVLRSSSFAPQIETGTTGEEVPRFLRVILKGPSETLVPQLGQVLSLVASVLRWDATTTKYVLTYGHSSAA